MASRRRNAAARVRLAGIDALTDAEAIAALVGDTDKASEIMAEYQDLPSLGRADLTDLERQVGVSKAVTLAVALEVGRRALAPRQRGLVVRASSDIYGYYACRLRHLTHEVFHVMCLDTKHRLIRDVRIVEGGLTTCSVLPREVFAPAMRVGASAVAFIHNHPSGDPTPSADDLALTARLKQAGVVLGIKPIDHVIIGEGRYSSLADEGLFASL